MKLDWGKWWYGLWRSVLKHIGTAGLGWGGINVAHSNGASVPSLDWRSLLIMLLAAGVFPALFAFLQASPLPDEIIELPPPFPPPPPPK